MVNTKSEKKEKFKRNSLELGERLSFIVLYSLEYKTERHFAYKGVGKKNCNKYSRTSLARTPLGP